MLCFDFPDLYSPFQYSSSLRRSYDRFNPTHLLSTSLSLHFHSITYIRSALYHLLSSPSSSSSRPSSNTRSAPHRIPSSSLSSILTGKIFLCLLLSSWRSGVLGFLRSGVLALWRLWVLVFAFLLFGWQRGPAVRGAGYEPSAFVAGEPRDLGTTLCKPILYPVHTLLAIWQVAAIISLRSCCTNDFIFIIIHSAADLRRLWTCTPSLRLSDLSLFAQSACRTRLDT